MTTIHKMRRLAEHRERMARLELAQAEMDRVRQQEVVDDTSGRMQEVLQAPSVGVEDHVHRHAYALRMEMARRGAERRLMERQRDVSNRRDALGVASREKGQLGKLIELRDEQLRHEARRREQGFLDEAGMQSWWRS